MTRVPSGSRRGWVTYINLYDLAVSAGTGEPWETPITPRGWSSHRKGAGKRPLLPGQRRTAWSQLHSDGTLCPFMPGKRPPRWEVGIFP